MHNGTVYRWNRPVYGVVDGKPTLRIENRPLPAGPTVIDSIANIAFLFGLTLGLVEEYGDVAERMPFHDCQANFYNARLHGPRGRRCTWLDGRTRPADELILMLLPLAARGLEDAGVDERGGEPLPRRDRRARRLGADRLALDARGLQPAARAHAARTRRCRGSRARTSTRQRTSRPVHTWKPARPPGARRTAAPPTRPWPR